MNSVIVRVWPSDYEGLKCYVCAHFPCYQPLKSDDLVCGVIVKVDGCFHVIICQSAFDKFDKDFCQATYQGV